MKNRRLVIICILSALLLLVGVTFYCVRSCDKPEILYTISFYDGSELLSRTTLAEGSILNIFPARSKPGHDLRGWIINTGESAVGKYVYGDFDVYADWSVKTYSIIFDSGEITANGEMPMLYVKFGTEVALEDNAYTSDKYRFVGWALTSSGDPVYSDGALIVMPASNLTLYAVWTVKRVKVILHGKSAEDISDITVDKYSPAPNSPWTYPGFTFVGWAASEEGGMSFAAGAPLLLENAEINLYGVYSADIFTLIFTDGKSEYRQYGRTGETVILSPCVFSAPYGYSFEHWISDEIVYEECAEYTIGAGGTPVFTVKWKPNLNAIIFHCGTTQNQTYTQPVYTGETVTLVPMAFEVKAIFMGWAVYSYGPIVYSDKECFTSSGEAVVRLFAVWEELPGFRITYDSGGGIGNMPDMLYKADETAIIDACGYTRPGYVFKAWTDGESEYLPGAKVTRSSGQNLHLTAIWQTTVPVTAVIRFVHGQNTREQYATLNTAVSLDGNVFIKIGNFFAGWAETADGEVKYRDKAQFYVGENTLYVLHAVFSPMKFTAYFVPMYLNKPTVAVDAFYGVTVEIPEYSRFGYLPPKWHSQPDAMGEELTADTLYTWLSDMTFYAMWDLADAIRITSATQLGLMRSNPGGVFVLEADIDLLGAEWTPICDSDNPFYGKIYGKGHKISNFKITKAVATARYYGFFGDFRGYAEALFIEGTINMNSSIPVTVGIFAGVVRTADIFNCRFSGRINLSAPDNYTVNGGGISGEIYGTTSVSGVIADVDIEIPAKRSNAGGLFGLVSGDFSVNIAACASLGNINVYADYACNAGGLIGNAATMPSILRSHYVTTYQSAGAGLKAASSWLGAPVSSALPRAGISATGLASGQSDLTAYIDDLHRQANPEAVFIWRNSSIYLYWEV